MKTRIATLTILISISAISSSVLAQTGSGGSGVVAAPPPAQVVVTGNGYDTASSEYTARLGAMGAARRDAEPKAIKAFPRGYRIIKKVDHIRANCLGFSWRHGWFLWEAIAICDVTIESNPGGGYPPIF